MPADHSAHDGTPSAPIRRRLGAAFGAGALVLLVGIVSLLSLWQLVGAFRDVDRSTHVATELRQVSASMLDAESGLRGYLLTGDDQFVAQFQTATRRARLDTEHLLADLADYPDLRDDATRLRQHAENRFAALDSVSFIAVTRGRDAAISLVRQGFGPRQMDSVRAVITEIGRSERMLLAQAAEERDRNTWLAAVIISGGTLIAFLLLIIVLIAVRREILHEARLRKSLIEQTQRLDAQATELELQNEQLQDQAVALEEQSSELEAQQSELEAANEELLRANSEVESSRERLQLLLQSAEIGMYGVDEQGRCSFVNPAATRMLGYTDSELLGEVIHDRIHHKREDGSPYPREQCPISRALSSGTRVRVDREVYWRRDGSNFAVDYTAAPMIGGDGRVHGAVVSFFDISTRRREEEVRTFLADATAALNASLDYRDTLRTVADLAVPRLGDWCAVDMLEDGELRRLAVVHRDPDKLRLVHDLSRRRPPSIDAPLGAGYVVRTGRAQLMPELPEELLVASAEGDVEAIRVIQQLGLRSYLGVPLTVQGQTVGAIVCVMAESGRRFTEQDLHVAEDLASRASLATQNALLFREAADARERAEGANRAKSQFLAAMSHELRTPLNAIAGYAELLTVGVHGPITDKQREALQRITRSQKTLLSLINDILNFSKLQAGYIRVSIEDVQIAELLSGLEAWVEPQLQSRELRYRFRGCPPEVRVRADREKLQQIMLNLLSNAVKFTPEKGEIAVRCEPNEREVLVEVSDTGPGIPPDKVEEIFEPFVQVDRGPQSTYQGTGLGLAISRDLARAMKGDLTVASTSPRGSTFALTIPRAADAGPGADGTGDQAVSS